MRSDVSQFELTAPPSLDAVLAALANEPGKHTLLAGGTELMVALGTGRLNQHSLLSIQHLRELRFIGVDDSAIHIGSGTTFTDIRRSKVIAADLPLMAQSASWTGSVANQNRGTLGGNICNASPAADTPPVLLAYGATLTLVSSGIRRPRCVRMSCCIRSTCRGRSRGTGITSARWEHETRRRFRRSLLRRLRSSTVIGSRIYDWAELL